MMFFLRWVHLNKPILLGKSTANAGGIFRCFAEIQSVSIPGNRAFCKPAPAKNGNRGDGPVFLVPTNR
jgi:hypothetical protein